MTSAEIDVVLGSWSAALEAGCGRALRGALADELDGRAGRAASLIQVTDDLVHLLYRPAALGARARELAAGPGMPGDDPSFAVDGRALMRALRQVVPGWSGATEQAWLMAWHLLAEEVALDRLSPFARTDAGTLTSDDQTIAPRPAPHEDRGVALEAAVGHVDDVVQAGVQVALLTPQPGGRPPTLHLRRGRTGRRRPVRHATRCAPAGGAPKLIPPA